MSIKQSIYALFIVQMILIIAFTVFVVLADQAMDKHGNGNFMLFMRYNLYAGMAFNIGIVFWLAAVITVFFGKCFKAKYAQIAIGLPPILIALCWLSIWFI